MLKEEVKIQKEQEKIDIVSPVIQEPVEVPAEVKKEPVEVPEVKKEPVEVVAPVVSQVKVKINV